MSWQEYSNVLECEGIRWITRASELLTVIMGDLEIEERLLPYGDSKPRVSVKSSLGFQSHLTSV